MFFLFFSYFGPPARNLFCSKPTGSQILWGISFFMGALGVTDSFIIAMWELASRAIKGDLTSS